MTTPREQADAWAVTARKQWEAGALADAAVWNHACHQVDPDRAPLWQARAARLLDAASSLPLADRNAVRLAVAGITCDDPGVEQIREHNRQVLAREQLEMGQ